MNNKHLIQHTVKYNEIQTENSQEKRGKKGGKNDRFKYKVYFMGLLTKISVFHLSHQ